MGGAVREYAGVARADDFNPPIFTDRGLENLQAFGALIDEEVAVNYLDD